MSLVAKRRKLKSTSKNQFIPTRVTTGLLEEIKDALKNVRGWGSVEIIVQQGRVTQITERNIRKTDHEVENEISS